MASNLTDLVEVSHVWGSDLTTTATGDVAVVGTGTGQVTKSTQRVLRRLMTNPGEYLFNLPYGGGVPAQIGQVIDVAQEQTRIAGQMLLEPSVQQRPAPTVVVTEMVDGLQCDTKYTVAPEAIPAVLSFGASA